MKLETDSDRFINFVHYLFVQVTYQIPESLFIDRTDLFQQDYRILDNVIPSCVDFHMCR